MRFNKLLLAALLVVMSWSTGTSLAANVSEWSTSASSNNATPPDGFPEGMAPSAVNDAAREVMAAVARWYKDTNGSLVTTGSGTAYAVTSNAAHAALADQSLIVAEIHTDSTGAATLAVDGLAAKDIVLPGGTAIAAGTLQAGAIAVFAWESDADNYILVAGATPLATGTAEGEVPALDAGGGLDSAIHGSAVPVGAVVDYIGTAAPAGWLSLNGDSIGSAASAADQASDDYENLFTLFWNAMADAQAPVSGGRGASAAADWAANKTLTLPDARGRGTIGSGSGTDLTARTHGATGGAEEHTLTTAEMPSHTHSITKERKFGSNQGGAPGWGNDVGDAGNAEFTTDAAGSGDPHNNMQPWLALTKIVRF